MLLIDLVALFEETMRTKYALLVLCTKARPNLFSLAAASVKLNDNPHKSNSSLAEFCVCITYNVRNLRHVLYCFCCIACNVLYVLYVMH